MKAPVSPSPCSQRQEEPPVRPEPSQVPWPLRGLLALLGLLPESLGYALCSCVGRVVYHLDGKRRRRGFKNLQLSLPHLSADEKRRIIRTGYRNLCCLGFEMVRSGKRRSREWVGDRIAIDGKETDLRGEEDESSGILVTAHTGNWEVLHHAISDLGIPVTAVARGFDETLADRVLTDLRTTREQCILGFMDVAAEAPRILNEGRHLAFVADQTAHLQRIWVPFFYRPAAFAKTPAALARRYGRTISVGFCRRTGPQFHFALKFYPQIRPDLNLDDREDIARMTGIWVGYLESFVREHPEEYLWIHRQWRTPPQGEELVRRDGSYIRSATFASDPALSVVNAEPVNAARPRPHENPESRD